VSTDETSGISPTLDQIDMAESGHAKFKRSVSDITRQSSISFLGTTFTLFVGYLFRVYLARTLGANLLGWNALGIGLYALCRLVGDLGLPYAAARYVAVYSSTEQEDRLRSFFWRALWWSLAGTSILCVTVIAARERIAAQFFHDPELAVYLPFYAVLIPIGTASSFALQALSGLKKVSRRTLITHFISFPFMMAATLIAVNRGFSLRGYVTAQIMGEALSLALAAWTIHRTSPMLLRLSDITGGALQTETWWYASSLLAITLLEFASSRADRLILGHYLKAQDIGIYAVAGGVAALCSMVLQAINSIFGPMIADLHARGEHDLLLRLYQTLTKWIVALTLPLILTLVVFSRSVMGIFGVEFQAGSVVLAVLALGQLANVGTGSVGTLLYMSGNQNRMIPVQVVVAVLALIGNVVLIPVFGITAAAFVAVFAVASTNVLYLRVVWRRMGLFPYNTSYFRLIVPVAAAAATIWLLHLKLASSLPAVPLLLVVLAISYSVFLAGVVALGLTADDRVIVHLARVKAQSMFVAK
jgi:O-antigen/teichoic acid export membrane protein